MTKKEKLEFRKQLYTKFQDKIDDCLNDLDNKGKLVELLYIFKGYFDARLIELVENKNVKQVANVHVCPTDKVKTTQNSDENVNNNGGEDNE